MKTPYLDKMRTNIKAIDRVLSKDQFQAADDPNTPIPKRAETKTPDQIDKLRRESVVTLSLVPKHDLKLI